MSYAIDTMYANERVNANGMILLSNETMNYIMENAQYNDDTFGPMGDLNIVVESETYNQETEQVESIINVYHNGQLVVENIIRFENNFYCTSIDNSLIF